MEVLLVFARPRQTFGAVVSWDLDDVPDVELNQAMAAGQDPQAFIAARNVDMREAAGRRPAASGRRTDPALHDTPGRETEAIEAEDLGLFGPDRPELDDVRAGEDMSAAAWAESSGEWPPSDLWVRRGLHNLVTRMTEDLEATDPSGPDDAVTVRAADLDNVLMMAVSALYEADARCGQTEGARNRQAELEAG